MFDKFSLEHIGKGEGAQAFSRGLYFAENEGIAKGYRDRLSGWEPLPEHAEQYDQLNTQHSDVQEALTQALADANTAVGHYGFKSPEYKAAQDFASKLLGQRSQLQGAMASIPGKSAGHMYEVNLNVEPEQLLNWDKPLRAQPSGVQSSLNGLGIVDPNMMGSAIPGDIARSILVQGSGRFSRAQSAEKAASQLNDAGIPGLRYLDAGSRGSGAGEGSHNIVMYNDKLIDIMRRFGIAGMAGGGAAATALPGQQDQTQ
jgi:hypothetical protein